MKKITYLIIFIFFACMNNSELTTEDKNQLLNQLKVLQNWYGPKENTIYWREKVKKWVLHDGSAKEVTNKFRRDLVNSKIKSLQELNITSPEYMARLNESLESFDTSNLGILLTNNKLGDNICKIMSDKVDINVVIWDDWLGEEEYLDMTDNEFDEFLKSRIVSDGRKSAIYKVPYFEISLRSPSLSEREDYVYVFHFIKSNEGKWLLNNIYFESLDS
jgi:hypothetical protein